MKKSLLILSLVALVFATGCKKEIPTTGIENGHEWVDLGLPSGTLWATCNVGATAPDVYGDYFAWGETNTKEIYEWDTYKYFDPVDGMTKYIAEDHLDVLEFVDDAARANWGGMWRMPTNEEMQELNDNCELESVSQHNVQGCRLTCPNGNSIFLPYAGNRNVGSLNSAGSGGFYWSSSCDTTDFDKSWFYHIGSTTDMFNDSRYYGFSVRPVCSALY